MKQNSLEALIGLIVIALAVGFFIFAYQASGFSTARQGYLITANFQNIEGISTGSDVRIAGIKVGLVENITLNDDTFYAEVSLRIDDDVEVPIDSRAIVATSGLLGSKYIRISPGAEETNVADQGKLKFTQSALNIEDLIGKLMYSLTSK